MRIVNGKQIGNYLGKEQFLVKWEGYTMSESSWEPKGSFGNKRVLEGFLKDKGEGDEEKWEKNDAQ